MKKIRIDYLATLIGIIMIVLGLFWVKTFNVQAKSLLALPYVCIGIGSGIFGHGMGNMISYKAIKRNPDIQKNLEIDKNDERNIAIANRAKVKTYNLMIFVLGALIVAFALMGVDLTAVLLLAFAYLLFPIYAIYYRSKYDKEM